MAFVRPDKVFAALSAPKYKTVAVGADAVMQTPIPDANTMPQLALVVALHVTTPPATVDATGPLVSPAAVRVANVCVLVGS